MTQEKIKIINIMFEEFQSNPLIKALRTKKGEDPLLRFYMFKMTELMTKSHEAQAFFQAREEILVRHNEEQKNLSQAEKKPLTLGHPEIVKLFNGESGLEIDRIDVPMQEVPEQFTAEDMANTSWMFNFTNGDGANPP